MNQGISDFALKLIFRNWRIVPVSITGLGIGAAIIAHLGVKTWSLEDTFVLMGAMVLLTIIAKCISFAYQLYEKRESTTLEALRFVKGDGLNAGNTIIVFSHAEGFCKGQLLTLLCSSSGARQPILVAEVIAVSPQEIQAVPINDIGDHKIRKYFEEESRRKMLFATSEVLAESIISEGFGARADE